MMAPNSDVLAPAEAPAGEILTADELAAMLRVNRKTIYDAIARGEIPGVRRVGGTLRIHRATVVGWISTGQGRVSRSSRRSK